MQVWLVFIRTQLKDDVYVHQYVHEFLLFVKVIFGYNLEGYDMYSCNRVVKFSPIIIKEHESVNVFATKRSCWLSKMVVLSWMSETFYSQEKACQVAVDMHLAKNQDVSATAMA